MVVMFGLYHGLVFLPVLLSIVGPNPYPSAYERHKSIVADIELGVPLQNGTLTSLQICASDDKDKEHDSLCNGHIHENDELKSNPGDNDNTDS
jgi:hypothetical protein